MIFPIGTSGVKGERPFLPDSSYVVLGLLSFGQDLTGYELRQWALGSVRFFWAAPAMSQIYRELDRLAGLAYVRPKDDSQGSERARTVYALTAAGRKELTRWLERSPVPPPELRHGVALRLFLAHAMSPERRLEMLRQHEAALESLLDDLRAVRAGLESDPQRWENALAVAHWGERFYGADLRSAREAADSFEQRG